jgi:hypothetical protein
LGAADPLLHHVGVEFLHTDTVRAATLIKRQYNLILDCRIHSGVGRRFLFLCRRDPFACGCFIICLVCFYLICFCFIVICTYCFAHE